MAAKQTNEGYLPKAVRSVLRQPRTVRDHESNPFGEAKHHKTRKARPIRESLSYLSMSVNGEDFQAQERMQRILLLEQGGGEVAVAGVGQQGHDGLALFSGRLASSMAAQRAAPSPAWAST